VKYNPKDATMCLPEGTYPATLEAVVDTTQDGSQLVSKKGEPMEYWVFRAYSDKGERVLRQYVTAGMAAWKYKQLAKAIDQAAVNQFEAGEFDPAKYVGTNFQLQLGVEEREGYGEQNNIASVLKSELTATPTAKPASKFAQPGKESGVMRPEDIPFSPRGIDGF
jgi:hypothetical protein